MNNHTPLTHPIPFTQPPSTMSLCEFVQQWEQDYQAKVACCRLFDAALMKKLLDSAWSKSHEIIAHRKISQEIF